MQFNVLFRLYIRARWDFLKDNLLIGVIVDVLILVAFVALFIIVSKHGKNDRATADKAKRLSPFDDDELGFYNPANFDLGIPSFAEECVLDQFLFDIHINDGCLLR